MTSDSCYTIDLLRHGPIEGPPALYGHTDVAPQREVFKRMQTQLAGYKGEYRTVVSSPLRRCAELAKAYAGAQALPLTIEPKSQEYSFGQLDGVPFDACSKRQQQALSLFWAHSTDVLLPGAEPYEMFRQRVSELWQQLCALSKREQSLLVITHGGVITALLSALLGLPDKTAFSRLKVGRASLTRIEFYHSAESAQIQFVGAPLL